MIKIIIGAVILGAAGIGWLRMQWAVSKNKKVAGSIIDGLKSGSFTVESFEESLGMLIRSKQITNGFSASSFKENAEKLANKKLREKFIVQYATMNPDYKGVVIAEAVVKGLFASDSNKEIDITYPCWIYIEINLEQHDVKFRSSMPESKDHHYLLEDIADSIFEECIK
jgi:hypothetical protein